MLELTKGQEEALFKRLKNHLETHPYVIRENWNGRTIETNKVRILWYAGGKGHSFFILSKDLNTEINVYDGKNELEYVKEFAQYCYSLIKLGNVVQEEKTEQFLSAFLGE